MLDGGCEVGLVAGVAFEAMATLDQAVATSRMPILMVSIGLARGVCIIAVPLTGDKKGLIQP
jgi:hypothetical protein